MYCRLYLDGWLASSVSRAHIFSFSTLIFWLTVQQARPQLVAQLVDENLKYRTGIHVVHILNRGLVKLYIYAAIST